MTPGRARERACGPLRPDDETAAGAFVAGVGVLGRLCVRAPAGPPCDRPAPLHRRGDHPRPGDPSGAGGGHHRAEHSTATDIDDEYPVLIVRED